MMENEPKIDHPGTIFLHGRIEKEAVVNAISTALEIPIKNIIIDDGTREGMDWDRQSVFINSYAEGDIGWMMDLICNEDLETFPTKLVVLSKLLNCAVYRDRHGIEYDNRVDVYNPDCVLDGAMLRMEEDENEDPVFFVELVE